MLTPEMTRLIAEQPLGFLATVTPDGRPSLSPKGTFTVLDDKTIAFGEIRSPGTIRNLQANPGIDVNFVDVFTRKGCRISGTASIVARGADGFDELLLRLNTALAPRIRAIVVIAIAKALPLSSPSYDDGATEESLRKSWTARLRKLQPGERWAE
jgi:predicted pyridoxine 5'-phosphate oxidase superfamily flavin-nucleotide-binding protein